MKISVNTLVKLGMLAALSVVLLLSPLRFPIIPAASFLIYEPADVPILIGSFLFGPFAGVLVTIVVSLIQGIVLNPEGGWVGIVMHIIATGTLVIVSGTIYKKLHTLKGAIIGLIAGSLSMTLIMIPSNLFFTVNFYKVPYDTVVAMLPTAIIPFNLIKAFINSALTMALYKSLGRLLKPQKENVSV